MEERVPHRATGRLRPGHPGPTAMTRRPEARLGALLLVGALAAVSVRAQVPEPVQEFDLPAGPLAATLLEIARHANVIVSFRPEVVGPHQAPVIRGRFTLLQALAQATRPSGLVVDLTPGGAIAIAEPAVSPVRAPVAAAPAASDPAAPAGAMQLPRVEIYGLPRQSDGLRALRSWSATRLDAAVEDLPQQVSVLTNEALALQGETNSMDATRYVPGVVLSR